MTTPAPARPPITCHVLDTTTGRPAANLSVKLSCVSLLHIELAGRTNSDGRIAAWEWANEQGAEGNEDVVQVLGRIIEEEGKKQQDGRPAGSSLWKLQFDTGSHYGIGNTFFPVIELSFLVIKGEHFHVPLLLGPYSFTTYRGS